MEPEMRQISIVYDGPEVNLDSAAAALAHMLTKGDASAYMEEIRKRWRAEPNKDKYL